MINNKKMLWWLVMLAVIILGFLLMSHAAPGSAQTRLCYHQQCFTLEIADTPQKRARGLMNRSSLAVDHGMIFMFPQEDMYDFWMKNTLIPLDMIRLDSGYAIVDIQEAVPCTQDPCSIYQAKQKARYIVELAGGTAKMLGLSSGAQFLLR